MTRWAVLIPMVLMGCVRFPAAPQVGVSGDGPMTIPYLEETRGGLPAPVIEGEINGVRGRFLVDTGAGAPILTWKAIQECGIPLAPRTDTMGTIGDKHPTEIKRAAGVVKVSIREAATGREFRFVWGDAYVTDGIGSDLWLGIIDFSSLRAAGAVIDTRQKRIIFAGPAER